MMTGLENFRPKLRAGRVLPQGSRIVFETDNPYNQVILPMALADLVLLCSGQFSVREIIAKIYKKQGSVPFRQVLRTIHVLHQGGFFENGHELSLSSDLQSWMEPRREDRWHLSWRFGQRAVAGHHNPSAFYMVTLLALICALLGLQFLPAQPFELVRAWAATESAGFFQILFASSALISLKYLFRAVQLLLLTGRVYNVSFRLSPWGAHFHVGNEVNDLFENRLFTVMFYISQILAPWMLTFVLSFALSEAALLPCVIIAVASTFWQLNPFVNSDGLKLIQSFLLPTDGEVSTWHFESSRLMQDIYTDHQRQDQEFGRVCAIWGAVWLLVAYVGLHQIALAHGPDIVRAVGMRSLTGWLSLAAVGVWLGALFRAVKTLIETVGVTLVRPEWRKFQRRRQRARPASHWTQLEITRKIESLPIFSHFHDEYLARILERSEVHVYDAEHIIIEQNDPARELFVLLEGDVIVTRLDGHGHPAWISELGAGSIFGEAALIEDLPRSARISAKESVTVLRVPVHVIRQVAESAQSIRHLEDFRNAILVNQFFTSSPVFRSLSPDSIDFLSSRGSLEYFDRGRTIFAQGDPGENFYLILRGSVEVRVHDRAIKRLHQGSFFGEIALIANIPRTATIATLEPAVFFKIDSNAFWEVLVRHLDLGVFLETISENRLKEDLKFGADPLKPTGTDSY